MKIKEIRQLPANSYEVKLKDNLLVNIKREGDVLVDTLIFEYNKNKYTLYEIFIPDEESDNFKYWSYEVNKIKIKDMSIEDINNLINEEIKYSYIIPLNYFNINNVYHKVNNIEDILNLRNILKDEDLNSPYSKVNHRISKRFEGDAGFENGEFDIVTSVIEKYWNSDKITFNDFIEYINTLQM